MSNIKKDITFKRFGGKEIIDCNNCENLEFSKKENNKEKDKKKNSLNIFINPPKYPSTPKAIKINIIKISM